jgi:hypothetical protein
MTNTRFEPIATGEAQFEIAAPEVFIAWNPEVQDGTITFNHAKYLMINGEIRYDIPCIRNGSITAPIAANFGRCFVPAGILDPVTGADLSQVSMAGIMVYAKAMFDSLHNEEHAPEPAP